MKALSIRQPWAWLIVNGHKDVENRTWHSSHVGPLLIHAGQQLAFGREEYAEFAARMRDDQQIEIPPHDSIERGGFVGRAFMRGCGPSDRCPSRWNDQSGWCFLMERSSPLPYVPYRGRLGIFDAPDDILWRVMQALGEERAACP